MGWKDIWVESYDMEGRRETGGDFAGKLKENRYVGRTMIYGKAVGVVAD